MKWQTPTGTWIARTRADILIREDGRIERTCQHGIGHPIGHLRKWLEWMGVHGCDGCCSAWTPDGKDKP